MSEMCFEDFDYNRNDDLDQCYTDDEPPNIRKMECSLKRPAVCKFLIEKTKNGDTCGLDKPCDYKITTVDLSKKEEW